MVLFENRIDEQHNIEISLRVCCTKLKFFKILWFTIESEFCLSIYNFYWLFFEVKNVFKLFVYKSDFDNYNVW